MGDVRVQSNTTEIERWRVFAAVPVNDAVRRIMWDLQRTLAPHNWPVRWVDPRLAHITLKFYGDTPAIDIPSLRRALESVAGRNRPVVLSTAGLGAFPTRAKPKVIWLGLAGDVARLDHLARDVEAVSGPVRERSNEKPFRAHVTLGRVREGSAAIPDFAEVCESVRLPRVELAIDRLELIRSVLGPKGPTYTTVDQWPIGARRGRPEMREHG